jgi:hypothetical protein
VLTSEIAARGGASLILAFCAMSGIVAIARLVYRCWRLRVIERMDARALESIERMHTRQLETALRAADGRVAIIVDRNGLTVVPTADSFAQPRTTTAVVGSTQASGSVAGTARPANDRSPSVGLAGPAPPRKA